MGKGSRARPFEVDQKQFADAWERTFGKKDKEKDIKEEKTENSNSTEKDESKETK